MTSPSKTAAKKVRRVIKREQSAGVGAALVEQIATYESDTFSAARWSMSRREAEAVAKRLIDAWALSNLDGIAIRATLDGVRARK